MQALAALGWPAHVLAARLGVSEWWIRNRRGRATPALTRASDARIRRLYADLSMTPGPSNQIRLRARMYGWAPPLAWDDDAIDDPAASPVTVLETKRDVAAEARFLASFGESLEHIAAQLGVLPTSVERAVYRKEAS